MNRSTQSPIHSAQQVQVMLDDYGSIVDIGQLSHHAKTYLDQLVKRGLLIKARGYWPWFSSGICCKVFYFVNE